ncbi:YhgE/Pip domain-containing protein [Microbacterium sp. STN6]|uniref:YhgE/Pip domain-containing protein n=1 Tax=Microbacterium sp. STN6 TaxID=2995588 RepID=UPI002260B7B0|nr:YhgE/Pip domain-containing protein [Microbacterium sp. STN6]MCX7522942.1 YhgE/Pip domain-containing protein [Microbacterium sp. STN6]
MKIPAMIVAELRRLTSSRMAVIALIALMTVPLLYGGLYLWANQDPYAKLDQVPVALVVDDAGTTTNGEYTNFGDEVAGQLQHDGSFQWHRVSAASAAHGIDKATYDFSVTLPADFSAALTSSSGANPHQARVLLTTNDANSYLSTTIGKQAIETIRSSIVKKVNEQAAGQFLASLATIRTSLTDAASGASQLADGAATASEGATRLADGTAQLSSGATDLNAGLATLQGATASLPAQTRQLADGARQVANGNATVASLGQQVAGAAADAAAAVPAARADIAAQLDALVTSGGLTRAQADAILARLDTLGGAVVTGNQTAQSAAGQLDRLSSGSAQVAAGAEKLADASPQLASGIASAASGAQSLASGAATVNDGAHTLAAGLPALRDGADELASGLASGADRIPTTTAASRHMQAANIADPVAIKTSAVTNAGTYGAGLAPFFVALAAWIGIYALFLIVKPVSRRAITALHSPLKVTLAGWLTPGLLGAVQMIGLFAIVAGWLGFGVQNPLGTYALMALASVSYAAIILALNVWLGSVGQFLGLVLMVLQLVTAGGTFPWQTLPAPLAALHHVLPMSFVVDGLRQLMYGGNVSFAWTDAGVIAAWGLGALVVAAVGVLRMTHFRTLRDLEPSLIG